MVLDDEVGEGGREAGLDKERARAGRWVEDGRRPLAEERFSGLAVVGITGGG
jgi:hypothetical protein